MVPTDSQQKFEPVTDLLRAWQDGDRGAADRLMPIVFGELRRIAARCLRHERGDHTYQPTALVNEAFLRLVDQKKGWQTRSHFFGIAAQVIRRILIDHARRAVAQRRGGPNAQRIPIDQVGSYTFRAPEELIALDRALASLHRFDPRLATLVEYRFFGGLTGEEIAELTGSGVATVQRQWQLARAFLYRQLEDDRDDAPAE